MSQPAASSIAPTPAAATAALEPRPSLAAPEASARLSSPGAPSGGEPPSPSKYARTESTTCSTSGGAGVDREEDRHAARAQRVHAVDRRQRRRVPVDDGRIGGQRGGVHPERAPLGDRAERGQVAGRDRLTRRRQIAGNGRDPGGVER